MRVLQVSVVKSARVCRRHEDASHLGYGYVNFFSQADKGVSSTAAPGDPFLPFMACAINRMGYYRQSKGGNGWLCPV